MKESGGEFMIIKLEAEIDTGCKPNECRIKPIKGNPWDDLAFFMECVAFLAVLARRQKGMAHADIQRYIQRYIDKAMCDYDKSRN